MSRDTQANIAEPMLKLSDTIEELIELAVAKGMSRRHARRQVAKLVEEHWRAGKIDIFGRRNDHGPLEVVPPDPDLILSHEPRHSSKHR